MGIFVSINIYFIFTSLSPSCKFRVYSSSAIFFFLGEDADWVQDLAEFLKNSTKSTYDIIHRMKRATPLHETITCCNEAVNENFSLPAETDVCFNVFHQVIFPITTFLGQFAVSFL